MQTNHLKRDIDWRRYFTASAQIVESQVAFVAKGGTIDSDKRPPLGRLGPPPHENTIDTFEGLGPEKILPSLIKAKTVDGLSQLYEWATAIPNRHVPWHDLRAKGHRIASFDSSQEDDNVRIAVAAFVYSLLQSKDYVIITQGTDTMVLQACLIGVLLDGYLQQKAKKVILCGAATRGSEAATDAINNLTAAIYAAITKEIPPGVYMVTASARTPATSSLVLHALSTIKQHADGLFYSPNTPPIAEIWSGRDVTSSIIPPLEESLSVAQGQSVQDSFQSLNLPGLLIDTNLPRLKDVLAKRAQVHVREDPMIVDNYYEPLGKKAYVIEAYGAMNGPTHWKRKIGRLVQDKRTVVVSSEADAGDLKPDYEATIMVEGSYSARVMRGEAVLLIAALCHEFGIPDPQEHIDTMCRRTRTL